MNELNVWEKESETKTKLEEAEVLNIAKKISNEFRPTIDSYIANYWDCGWIRSAEVLTEKEIKKLEKALCSITSVKHEVPYLYKGEETSTWTKEKRILTVNRCAGTVCIETYDDNNKLLNMYLNCEIDKDSISHFFQQFQSVDNDRFNPAFDLYNKHTLIYASGKSVCYAGLIKYRNNFIPIFDLAEEKGLIK